ncbi:glycosyltransferase family 2 protein [Sphingomonas arantia]|uniref:Glycosyltransferase family 2 protein n=1 Tax=Sphingomonas arantia TaxID=1460676 RepID=A0ABW4TSB8_9SPHN
MTITVGIKALNEAAHIAAAIDSACAAVAPFGGRVVLADSGSSDATVAIGRACAAQGVRTVQLADPGDRSCGAGAQLAWQYAEGEYFCLIDGDMTLQPGFVAAAVAYLAAHPDVAGVGGRVIERNLETAEFQIRAKAAEGEAHRRAGPVDRLDGGGVYRVSAIRRVGYFADRNLHAFEELDLAVRLALRGGTLVRLNMPAVDHHGHRGSGYRLLLRRLVSGYASGAGEVLRGALGRPHLPLVLRRLGHLRHGLVILLWWAALIAAGVAAPIALPVLVLVPLGYLSVRRGGIALGLYSLCQWNVIAVGLIRGLCRSRVPPTRALPAVEFSPAERA